MTISYTLSRFAGGEEEFEMNRKTFILAAGLAVAAFAMPRLALAESHLSEAITHTKEAIEHERLQQSILRSLAARMRSGSQIAYITCTLRPNENEKQIERLVRESYGLQVLRQWQSPHDHPWLEGMFGALLQKI